MTVLEQVRIVQRPELGFRTETKLSDRRKEQWWQLQLYS